MGSLEASVTWLDELQRHLQVDIDSMDPTEATRSLPFKPKDQTSNQRLVYEQMVSPENREMFLRAVKEYKQQGWESVLDRVVSDLHIPLNHEQYRPHFADRLCTVQSALLCARNMDNIEGRVLLQSSPKAAYDTDKVVAHARNYARELEKVGISKDRFCIKVPCTGPAMNASRILLKEGIRTLGTSLFSLPQAIAASQAGCLSISPYYNLPWYHTNAALWPDVKDPALDHPMSPRIIHILDAYRRLHAKTGQQQPMLKPASFKCAREAMAMAELGCQSATIPGDIIQELSMLDFATNPPTGDFNGKRNGSPSARLVKLRKVDPLAEPNWNGQLASLEVDYLADNGAALTKAIGDDSVTQQGLREALEAFAADELRSRAAIEEAMAPM